MKKIVYTQRVEVIQGYNERRDCADQKIAELLFECGYLPVPINNNPAIAANFMEEQLPDGILLTGGNDLVKYGGNAPERDKTESVLINYALSKNIPVYGFCRGMQKIADYFGCELIHVDNHAGTSHILYADNDYNEKEVNSYHNYAIKEVSKPLEILARASDGVIESVSYVNKRIYGTMWHPERANPFDEQDIKFIHSIFG